VVYSRILFQYDGGLGMGAVDVDALEEMGWLITEPRSPAAMIRILSTPYRGTANAFVLEYVPERGDIDEFLAGEIADTLDAAKSERQFYVPAPITDEDPDEPDREIVWAAFRIQLAPEAFECAWCGTKLPLGPAPPPEDWRHWHLIRREHDIDVCEWTAARGVTLSVTDARYNELVRELIALGQATKGTPDDLGDRLRAWDEHALVVRDYALEHGLATWEVPRKTVPRPPR
jgi:hypothetical protein